MREYLDYDIKYPDLVVRMLDYFRQNHGDNPKKTVADFCEWYKVPEGESIIQPQIVGLMCERLWNKSILYCVHKGAGLHTKDIYCSLGVNQEMFNKYLEIIRHHFNSIVYGFEYIYEHYKKRTLPVIVKTDKGDDAMGSCFRIYDGIATAKHCLTDGKSVSIRGYSKEQLSRCKVLVSKDENIDLAFIRTGESYIYNNAEPRVLNDVLVMGYPKVPLFVDFCAGEKANISAMADLRFTPTRGSIAAIGEIFFPRNLPKMLLVTAKISGGNSGGPVINDEGYVVGVSTNIPAGEGGSDDHVGYGIAYPIKALNDMIKEENEIKLEFGDFSY